jgi:hypothetical protein
MENSLAFFGMLHVPAKSISYNICQSPRSTAVYLKLNSSVQRDVSYMSAVKARSTFLSQPLLYDALMC